MEASEGSSNSSNTSTSDSTYPSSLPSSAPPRLSQTQIVNISITASFIALLLNTILLRLMQQRQRRNVARYDKRGGGGGYQVLSFYWQIAGKDISIPLRRNILLILLHGSPHHPPQRSNCKQQIQKSSESTTDGKVSPTRGINPTPRKRDRIWQ